MAIDGLVTDAGLVIDEKVATNLLGTPGLPQLVVYKVPGGLGNAGAVCTVLPAVVCQYIDLLRTVSPEAPVTT